MDACKQKSFGLSLAVKTLLHKQRCSLSI